MWAERGLSKYEDLGTKVVKRWTTKAKLCQDERLLVMTCNN